MKKINSVQPPLHFIDPAFDIKAYYFAKLFHPFKIRFQSPIRKIEFSNIEVLGDLYSKFANKKARLMIAFRHPNADDPLCLIHIFSRLLPDFLKKNRIKIDDITHFHFVWDRGIPLWAGDFTGKLYSRLGGTPIHRGKVDWKGLNSIRNLFANGRFPLAIAPEGATNGHNEIIGTLEPGIGQMGLWCLDDLEKQGRKEDVYIMPLGIQYSYIEEDWNRLETLLDSFIHDLSAKDVLIPSGLTEGMNSIQAGLYEKLYKSALSLLSTVEDYYQSHYGCLPKKEESTDLPKRLHTLLDNILTVPEQFFQVTPRGNIIDRCRKLEQASWNWIYREDVSDSNSLIQKRLLDRMASQSKEMDWHMRLVESFVSVTGTYIKEKPSFERFTEITYLLFDTISKIKTGSGQKRPDLGKYKVRITAGNPILVNEYHAIHKTGKRGTKEAIEKIGDELFIGMNELIHK
jgi:hypothetical protein